MAYPKPLLGNLIQPSDFGRNNRGLDIDRRNSRGNLSPKNRSSDFRTSDQVYGHTSDVGVNSRGSNFGQNDRSMDLDRNYRTSDYNRTSDLDRDNRGSNYDTSLDFGRKDRNDFGRTLNPDHMKLDSDFSRTSSRDRDDHGGNDSWHYNPIRSNDFDNTLKLGRSSNFSNDYVGSSNLGQSDRNLGRSVDLVQNKRVTGYDNTLNMGLSNIGSNLSPLGNTISPWQSSQGPSNLQNLPLTGVSTEAISLAANLINLLNPKQQQNAVPSLLDMPLRPRAPPRNEFNLPNRGFGPGRMSNQSQFRSTGTFNRSAGRIEKNRPNKPFAGSRQQIKSFPRKDNYSKAKPVTKSEQSIKKEDDKKKTEKVLESPKTNEKSVSEKSESKTAGVSVFDEIRSELLVCHICKKSMWDGRSFENHLRGKAHEIMMKKTALSYDLAADTMRKQFQLAELKRAQNTVHKVQPKYFCKMCNHSFHGRSHRTGIHHQKLKSYLHPTCTVCNEEMKTRIQFDEHRLTLDHLRNLQKNKSNNVAKAGLLQLSNLETEKSYLCAERQERDEKKRALKKSAKAGGTKEEKTSDEVDELILDYDADDDFDGCTYDMIPLYNTNRGVGKSFITEFHCYHCKLCNKLLDTEETAEVHLKTWKHYSTFSKFISGKIKSALAKNRDKDSPKTGEKRTLPAEEGESKKPKSDTNEQNEGEGGPEGEEENNGEDEENEVEMINEDVGGDGNGDVIEVPDDDDDEIKEIGKDVETAPADDNITAADNNITAADDDIAPADDDLEDWEEWSDPKDVSGEVKPEPVQEKKVNTGPAVKQNKPTVRGRGRGRRRN